MNYHFYSRKKKKLNRLLKLLKSTRKNSVQFKKLILKIRKVATDLKRALSLPELRKVLGPAAVLLGMSFSTVNAQQFDLPVTNAFGAGQSSNYFFMPDLADLDGDGDLDIIGGNYNGLITYQRNSGTNAAPSFDPPQVTPFGLTPTYILAFPDFVDLDGDGDFDLMVGEYYGRFQYFENVGTSTTPQFTAPTVNPFGLSATYYLNQPHSADMDGDGDMDIISLENYGSFQYFENIGSPTNPQFAAPVANPFGLMPTPDNYFGELADWDMDGDMDYLSTEYYGDFQYFENTGTATAPQFAPPVKNAFNLIPQPYFGFPTSGDLDADGDLDLLMGTYAPAGVEYYENLAFPVGADNDGDGFPNTTDCNDADPNTYPGATEICDGKDNNCDGVVDEGFPQNMYYRDSDGDNYGNPNNSIVSCAATPPSGYVVDKTDCDDFNPFVNPGATEICDGIDNNCDGDIDEGVSFTHYLDADNDNYGDAAFPIVDCSAAPPTGYVSNPDDCDDSNPNINPGATDIPNNGIDEDCDGMDATTTANENQAAVMGLQVYPNPTASMLTVTAETDEEVTVSIFDQTGKLMMVEQRTSLKSDFTINVNGFAEGVYLLKLQDKDGNIGTRRFSVLR